MSLLALLVIVLIVIACVMAMMPGEKKPAPIAVFKVEKGSRAAELLLFPGGRYTLKYSMDGKTAVSDQGSYRQEGKSGEDGTIIFMVSADGKERQMVYDKGELRARSEDENIGEARSILQLDFKRTI